MNLTESFRIAWQALLTHKLRSLLTMLGIIIGVGAVVGMLAIGNGLAAFFQQEFNRLGIGVFYVSPQVERSSDEEEVEPRLTAADAAALLEPGVAPAVNDVALEFTANNAVISAGGERYVYRVQGLTPNYFSITDQLLTVGRYYDAAEERGASRVVVIGKDVAETLFGSQPAAVGQRVTVNGVLFDVVGVLGTEPSQIGASFITPGETVYMPYSTATRRLFRNQLTPTINVDQLIVQAGDRTVVDAAIEQTRAVLRDRHRLQTFQPDDFSIDNPEQEARQANAAIAGLNAFLGIIAGISLLVGGIGIMNIMLVSVTQRTREIGLRKAVGAKRRDIMIQFLVEAVTLCLLGGALGVALGFTLSFAGTFVLENVFNASGAQAVVTLNSILLATIIASSIGLFFGLFPALRAARLDPITALRKE